MAARRPGLSRSRIGQSVRLASTLVVPPEPGRPATAGKGHAAPEPLGGTRMAIRDYDRLFIGGDWVAPEGTDTIG